MWQFSYMFSLIPDSMFIWITYTLFGLGAILYIVSKFVSILPFIKQYKFPVELLGVMLLVVGSYFYGGYATEKVWRERVAELEAKIAKAEEESKKVNVVIKEKIVTKIKEIKVFQDRIKEVIVEKEKIIDAQCKVPQEALDILNDSAKGVEDKK